jgi:hypothetical protein
MRDAHQSHRLPHRLAVGAISFIGLAGCQGGGAADDWQPVEGYDLVRGESDFEEVDSFMEAGWGGELQIEQGCVVLVDGSATFFPVFFADSQVVERPDGSEGLAVRVSDDIVLPLGTTVSGGGGYVEASESMSSAGQCDFEDELEVLVISTINQD